ncbi:MAG TPA: hypothetical protein VL173_18675 [Vicinamibacterales bacterium]|jgi:hypothetical protein|nr:hypothetical protein [Vicinamibacterales bacterium]
MFAKLVTTTAAVVFCAQVSWAQTAPSPSSSTPHPPPPADEAAAAADTAVSPSIVGTWKAKTEKLPLTGDFNEKVWGRGAQSVRDITLTVRPGGEATLTVARKVINKVGKVVAGSARTEQADVKIGSEKPGFATRIDHDVTVVKAERRYSDKASETWPLENLRVGVVTFTDSRNALEVRFDPVDGQGAFAELLTRTAATRSRK